MVVFWAACDPIWRAPKPYFLEDWAKSAAMRFYVLTIRGMAKAAEPSPRAVAGDWAEDA